MKTLFIVTFLLFTLNLSSNELNWVDEQVNAIKPPRNGVRSSTISRLKDPFIFLRKKGTSKSSKTVKSSGITPNSSVRSSSSTTTIRAKKRTLSLDAIMNHSALISGKWYRINDKVGAYTLSAVNQTSVVLTNKAKSLILSTNSRNLNLKFKNK